VEIPEDIPAEALSNYLLKKLSEKIKKRHNFMVYHKIMPLFYLL